VRVSLQVVPGERVALPGPSGRGKSALLPVAVVLQVTPVVAIAALILICIERWVSPLYGIRKAAHAMMIRDSPEMTEAEIEAGVAPMDGQGILDTPAGIGAMSAARIADCCGRMVKAGLHKPGEVDLSKGAAPQFVNKKVGQDLKRKLGATK
jgi:hypothetical protein